MPPNLLSGPCVFGAFQPGRLLLRSLSIGRLQAGRPEAPVNIGLADRQAGNPRKHWAGGQPLRKHPFYAGFGAGVVADIVGGLRQLAVIQLAMLLSCAAGSATQGTVAAPTAEEMLRSCASGVSMVRGRLRNVQDSKPRLLPVLDVTLGYLNRLAASPRQSGVCGQVLRKLP